jgi:hypothetical protein
VERKRVFMGKLLKFSGVFIVCLMFFAGCNNQRERQIDWSASTITIRNEAELRQLANVVNSGQRHFKGQTIILANDIDIDRGRDWESIGYPPSLSGFISGKNFRGIFDGNGKTIRGNSGDLLFDSVICSNITDRQGLNDWGVVRNLNTVGIQIALVYSDCR